MISLKENLWRQNIEFINQFDAFPRLPTIGSRMCGIASATMGINIVRGRNRRISAETVLTKATMVQRIPDAWGTMMVEYHPVSVYDDAIQFFLPIGEDNGDMVSVIEKEIANDPYQRKHLGLVHFSGHEEYDKELARKQYLPIISLGRGTDHRGLKVLFAEYGIHAEKYGDINQPKQELDDIIDKVKLGDLIIASVRHKTDSSHVVLLTQAKRQNRYVKQGAQILVCDPLKHAPEWVDASQWYSNDFRGYGTIIYAKE